VATAVDLQMMTLQKGVHISYRLVQQAFVKVGWHNRSCLTVDKMDTVAEQPAGCSMGTLSPADVVVADSYQLDVDGAAADDAEDDLVQQAHLQHADY